MQEIIWQGVRLEIPADWEMLKFSKQQSAGRCGFADRYQFRLQMGWRTVEGQPDFDRMLSDYVSRLRDDGSVPDARTIRVGRFRGIEGHQVDGTLTTRFSRYFPEAAYLVEVAFLWPDRIAPDTQSATLDGLAVEPMWHERFRRWKAFGMDLLASHNYPLIACDVQPAAVKMIFSPDPDGNGPNEQFERRGMIENWLCAPVAQWLSAGTPTNVDNVSLAGAGEAVATGHPVAHIVGTARVSGVKRLLKRTLRYEAAAWICPEDGRLYKVSITEPDSPEAQGLDSAADRLVCCAGFGASRERMDE